MNGDRTDNTDSSDSARCPLWERLGCARGVCARLCRRRRRVAPEHATKSCSRSRESRHRINHAPAALYSVVGERLRTNTPQGLQCALFCGGARCPYERPQTGAAIQGLYSDWITDDILAMARPSTATIAARNVIQQFHSWGVRTVINLQTPGEHASCGPPLTKSGFTYDPTVFMANDIYYYNFAWPDYGEASLSGLLNMAKVLSFALQEGRVAIHCHAAIVIYIKLKFEPIKGVCKSNVRLNGKIVLVTGGNQGIGLETARDLASRGARVVIACRNGEKSAQAIKDIVKTTGNQNITYQYLDLADFSCVRKFAEDFNQTHDKLDILIHNAGCVGLKHKATKDGIDTFIQVNYLGPFLLTNLLLDKIKASPAGRIVVVSSCAHYLGRLTPDTSNGLNPINSLNNYPTSRLCAILWTKALAKRLPSHVTVNSLHPGIVYTEVFEKLNLLTRTWLKFCNYVLNFKTPMEGAQTTIHLAVSDEVANVSGKYFMECKEADYSKIADDDELVEKIWNKSVMLTI